MNTLYIIAGTGVLAMLAEMLNFKKLLFAFVIAGIAAALVSAVREWNTGLSYFNDMLRFDNYAIAFSGLLLVIMLLWFMMAKDFFRSESSMADHFALIVFALGGAVVMVSFADLTMLFIGIETLSLAFYVLAGSNKTELRSNEAGFKYFMMGAFATGFLLFGIALIYGATGTFNLERIAHNIQTIQSFQSLSNSSLMLVYAGIILVIVGLAFKVSAVPFHFWAPDVYEGAPTQITALMATMVKTAAFGAFLRLFMICFEPITEWWAMIIAILSAASMLGGNILAVYQKSFKRMLAYSSIAHAGYMLMAVVAINEISQGALLLYAAAYSIASLGAFVMLASPPAPLHPDSYRERGELNTASGNELVNAFKGFGYKHPLAGIALTVVMLSFAGIPPVAGFFAKYYIFYAALKSGFVWLVLLAVLSSLIGVYYYFRIIIAMYQQPDGESVEFNLPSLLYVLLLLCAALSLLLGIMPSLVTGLL